MKFKKIFCLIILFLCLFMVSCDNENSKISIDERVDNIMSRDNIYAEIIIKDLGSVKIKLDKENAPITVRHFVTLSENGDYDNTYITRIQPGFVVQAGEGCKNTETITGEFSENGIDNSLSHTKGVISMARSNSYNSASYQFFIVLDDNASISLDGAYASFGIVIEGMDIIDEISASLTIDMVQQNYYGYYMGFLKEEYYIVIETIKIVEN